MEATENGQTTDINHTPQTEHRGPPANCPNERESSRHNKEKEQCDEARQEAKRSGEATGTLTIRVPEYESKEVDTMECGEEVDEDMNDATDVQSPIRTPQNTDNVRYLEREKRVRRGNTRGWWWEGGESTPASDDETMLETHLVSHKRTKNLKVGRMGRGPRRGNVARRKRLFPKKCN